MKMLVHFSLLLMLALAVGACAQTRAESGAHLPSSAAQENRVPGEYLVGLVAGSDQAAVRDMFTTYGVEEWRHVRKDTYLVRLRSDPGPEALARLAKASATVRYIEPNRIYTTQ